MKVGPSLKIYNLIVQLRSCIAKQKEQQANRRPVTINNVKIGNSSQLRQVLLTSPGPLNSTNLQTNVQPQNTTVAHSTLKS